MLYDLVNRGAHFLCIERKARADWPGLFYFRQHYLLAETEWRLFQTLTQHGSEPLRDIAPLAQLSLVVVFLVHRAIRERNLFRRLFFVR